MSTDSSDPVTISERLGRITFSRAGATAGFAGSVILGVGLIFAPSEVATAVGIALTAAAIVIAAAIFHRQKVSGDKNHAELMGGIEGLSQANLKRVREGTNEDLASSIAGMGAGTNAGRLTATDSNPDDDAVLDSLGLDLGDGTRVLDAADVPLHVLYDLIGDWVAKDKTGRWNLGALIGAARRVGVKGNHPWVVIFRNPRNDVVELYQVSKGGRGKHGASVRKL